MMLRHYIQEAFEPTLLFGPLCSLLGILAASFYSKVSIGIAVLLIIGIFFVQMSMNVLDDYVDYRRGIDAKTTKTRFSGGTDLIVDGKLRPNAVLLMGISTFAIAAAIGVYMIATHPVILPIVAIGAVSVILYASYLVNVPFLAEPLVALNYMLVGVASFMVIVSSSMHLPTALIVSFPGGAVIGMALLVNEMPDRTVDKKHGRRSGAVLLGTNSRNSYYYLAWQVASYAVILYGIAFGFLPRTDLIILALIPFAAICFLAMRRYSGVKNFERYMGINSIYAIIFQCLLVVGYILVII